MSAAGCGPLKVRALTSYCTMNGGAFIRISFLVIGQSQSCTNGFPTMEVIASSGSPGSNGVLRIIPALKFNCSGFLTKWTLAARIRGTDFDIGRFVQLQVWRSTGGSAFIRTGSTLITTETQNLSDIYEQRPLTPLQVEVGDFLGIFQPFSPTLQVRYETSGGPTNFLLHVAVMPWVGGGHDEILA